MRFNDRLSKDFIYRGLQRTYKNTNHVIFHFEERYLLVTVKVHDCARHGAEGLNFGQV